MGMRDLLHFAPDKDHADAVFELRDEMSELEVEVQSLQLAGYDVCRGDLRRADEMITSLTERVRELEDAFNKYCNAHQMDNVDAWLQLKAAFRKESRQVPESESPLTGLLAEIDKAKAESTAQSTYTPNSINSPLSAKAYETTAQVDKNKYAGSSFESFLEEMTTQVTHSPRCRTRQATIQAMAEGCDCKESSNEGEPNG